jgi:hypothetical protein
LSTLLNDCLVPFSSAALSIGLHLNRSIPVTWLMFAWERFSGCNSIHTREEARLGQRCTIPKSLGVTWTHRPRRNFRARGICLLKVVEGQVNKTHSAPSSEFGQQTNCFWNCFLPKADVLPLSNRPFRARPLPREPDRDRRPGGRCSPHRAQMICCSESLLPFRR